MSGTIQVRPIKANLLHDHDLIGKQDPYCIVHLGQYNVKGQVCKNGGRYPQWGDTITVQRNYEKVLLLEIRDKDKFSTDDAIGVCYIDLSSLPSNTPVSQWYPLQRWHSNAGEILVELTFSSNMQQFGGQMGGMQTAYCPFKVSPYLGSHVQMNMTPATGYQQPNYAQSTYQQPIMQGGFQQQPVMQGGFQQQPMMQGGIQQQPIMQGGIQQPMMQGGFQQQPIMQGGFQQQPMMQGGFQQPVMQGGIQQPMMQGGFQQPVMQGGVQQPMYQQQQAYGQPGYIQPRPY